MNAPTHPTSSIAVAPKSANRTTHVDRLENFLGRQAVHFLTDRPDLEFYDIENVVISGWVVDVTCDGTSYPFGTCTHPGGDGTTRYFCFDEFGWSSWPDAAGLMCGLHYAMTGQKLPGLAA